MSVKTESIGKFLKRRQFDYQKGTFFKGTEHEGRVECSHEIAGRANFKPFQKFSYWEKIRWFACSFFRENKMSELLRRSTHDGAGENTKQSFPRSSCEIEINFGVDRYESI